MQNKLPSTAGRPDRYPQDDPFLEALFGTMCQSMIALPGENFVDRAQRWIEGLRFTAGLRPRDQQEWLQAAEITTKQFSAVYSLVMQRRKGATAKQRAKYGQDYIFQIKAVHEARLRYDMFRTSRPD